MAVLLDQLGVPDDARVGLLGRVLARDPGWPAHLAWRARTGVPLGGESEVEPLAPARDLLELAAVRLALEVVVVGAWRPDGPGDTGTVEHAALADRAERRRASRRRRSLAAPRRSVSTQGR